MFFCFYSKKGSKMPKCEISTTTFAGMKISSVLRREAMKQSFQHFFRLLASNC